MNNNEDLLKQYEEIKKENNIFRLLTENSIDILFLLDTEANFIYLSNSFEKETEYLKKEMIGKNIKDILTTESYVKAITRLNKWKNNETSLPTYEIQIITKKNTIQDYEVTTFPIFEGGKLKFISGIARNISYKKLIEKKIIESENFYRALAENSQDVIWITDMKGKFTYVSPSVERLIGYTPEEVMKQTLADVICPGSLPQILENYVLLCDEEKEQILKTQMRPYEVEQICKDGSTVWTEVIIKILFDDKGKKVGVLGVSRDISERKKSQGTIARLNDTLKLLNKILRHDISNNLTVVLMSLEMLKTEDTNLKEKAIKSVYKSVNLIERIRELENAIPSGIEIKKYNLNDVFEDISNEYKNIEFNIRGNCNVLADSALVYVIENIVRNASIHGKTERIDFDLSQSGNKCILRISDFGVGIPESIKDKIFDEGFSYGDYVSSGLGLFIAKKTIERYGGEIHYEKNEPKGSVFVIILDKAD